jgi:hypothetical protein
METSDNSQSNSSLDSNIKEMQHQLSKNSSVGSLGTDRSMDSSNGPNSHRSKDGQSPKDS